MATFREAITARFRGVGAASTAFARALLAYIGLGADEIVDMARMALRAPWLRHPDSPPDALPLIGKERGIERAPAETDVQYRARLVAAWDLWEQAGTGDDDGGTSFAQNALEPFDVDPSGVTVKYWTDTDWEPNTSPTNFSCWWVILDGDLTPWSLDTWGGGAWDDGATWGTDATNEEVAAVRRFLNKFKAGHEIGVAVILDYGDGGGDVWGVGTWGSGTWDGRTAYWHMAQMWGEQYGQPGVWGDVHPLHVGHSALWGGKIT